VSGANGYSRRASFAILVIALVTFLALVAGVLYWVLKSAAEAEPALRDYLMKMAALATAVLVLTVLILFAVVIRHIASRITSPTEKPTAGTYENAWAEAGRRLKPEDAPPVPGFEEEEPED
jgi:uncharacterized protein involved in cysteine biosynthesis